MAEHGNYKTHQSSGFVLAALIHGRWSNLSAVVASSAWLLLALFSNDERVQVINPWNDFNFTVLFINEYRISVLFHILKQLHLSIQI